VVLGGREKILVVFGQALDRIHRDLLAVEGKVDVDALVVFFLGQQAGLVEGRHGGLADVATQGGVVEIEDADLVLAGIGGDQFFEPGFDLRIPVALEGDASGQGQGGKESNDQTGRKARGRPFSP